MTQKSWLFPEWLPMWHYSGLASFLGASSVQPARSRCEIARIELTSVLSVENRSEHYGVYPGTYMINT